MVGLLIVTHCNLGAELLNAAKFIVGEVERTDAVAITETAGSDISAVSPAAMKVRRNMQVSYAGGGLKRKSLSSHAA